MPLSFCRHRNVTREFVSHIRVVLTRLSTHVMFRSVAIFAERLQILKGRVFTIPIAMVSRKSCQSAHSTTFAGQCASPPKSRDECPQNICSLAFKRPVSQRRTLTTTEDAHLAMHDASASNYPTAQQARRTSDAGEAAKTPTTTLPQSIDQECFAAGLASVRFERSSVTTFPAAIGLPDSAPQIMAFEFVAALRTRVHMEAY